MKNEHTILKKGTLNCPCCKLPLHFELVYKMRVIRDGHYSAYCANGKNFFLIPARKQE